MIHSANNMRHAHVVIVNDDRQIIGWRAVGTQYDQIIQILVVEAHATLHAVFYICFSFRWSLEPDNWFHAGGRRQWIAITPSSIVALRPSLCRCPRAHIFKFL